MKKALLALPGVGEKTVKKLFDEGFSMKKLATVTLDAMTAVKGLSQTVVERILGKAAEFIAAERQQARERRAAEAKAAAQALAAPAPAPEPPAEPEAPPAEPAPPAEGAEPPALEVREEPVAKEETTNKEPKE
jgi:DNA replication initiation complex subunit (GINS family)